MSGARYVVSDIHGHLADLRSGLRSRGLVDAHDRWAGGDDTLWVLGDLVDRGPDGAGVIAFLMALQQQAPEQVHVLLGNHEVLALGFREFPDSQFAGSWEMNGGIESDQAALSAEQATWLAGLPALARVDDFLLAHSDTLEYLTWGSTLEEVNASVHAALTSGDVDRAWDVWGRLCNRFDFTGRRGPRAARSLLDAFGGRVIVHGHTIVGSLLHVPSEEVTEPVLYADGLALAIDGGRYDGGPLLIVRLD